ncbi:adenylate kinase 7, partial [Austrofundulus limnaeus]|uniref:Adenylate kinase 7 n=1 Tax=Austrofundulus limnaeus TaxID=52670 RepID=A0A2I4AL28_AUSLI
MEETKKHKRVFVNDVDRYSSQHIAKFLSTCEAGDLSEDEETGPEVAFQVVGTVSSPEKLDFLHQQYDSPSRDELLRCLLGCDVVVYNVSESSTPQQVDEATWALTGLHAELKTCGGRKMFILISTVMTWARTKPEEADGPEPVFSEEDVTRRRPHPSFRKHKDLEKLVLKLAKEKKSKLTCYVVAAGLQYGMEE